MTRLVVAFVVAIIATADIAHAQPEELALGEVIGPMLENEPPFVELYTFGGGEVIFERFGHATICLRYHDETRFPAICFNYGVTDFADEGASLTWNFLRGQQRFWVEPTKYATMFQFYASENRDIWRQKLDSLDLDERRSIEAELWHGITEENRYYVYDHFFDNCTTRIRDLLDTVSGGKLRANASGEYEYTFRDLGKRGLAGLPPLIALADFVLGRQLDDHPTLYEAMFWPDVMRDEIYKRFGAKPEKLHDRAGEPLDPVGSTGRFTMFLVAFVFTLPLLGTKLWRRFRRTGIALSILYPGIWGLAIWILVAISPIRGVRWNELVLVLVPLDLALPFVSPKVARSYARVRLAICFLVSALAGIGLLHQPIWIPLLSVVMPMALIATRWRDPE